MSVMTVEVVRLRRRAEISLSVNVAPIYKLTPGIHACYVLECLLDGDTPVFVCEMLDGSVHNVYTEYVRFTDTEGGTIK